MANNELLQRLSRGDLVFLVREGPRPSIGWQLPNTASQIMRGIGLESSLQPSRPVSVSILGENDRLHRLKMRVENV